MCIARSKSLAQLELVLNGFSIHGITKKYLWNLPAWYMCLLVSVLSTHAAALVWTPLTHTECMTCYDWTKSWVSDNWCKTYSQLQDAANDLQKSHSLLFRLKQSLGWEGHVPVDHNPTSTLLQSTEETNTKRRRLGQFRKQQWLFWQLLTAWAWVDWIFFGFKTIVAKLIMPKMTVPTS